MFKQIRNRLLDLGRRLLPLTARDESPAHYRRMRRNLTILMILVAIIPLTLMTAINFHEYQKALKGHIVQPLRVLLNKSRHSFELFLAERRSAVSFIASAYTYDQLADEQTLNHVFQAMKREFGGFVDLGLIDATGRQVSYVGPYKLLGKNYRGQAWFQEVNLRGTHISDVFMGFRKYPHFVIAVLRPGPQGKSWIVRATIDTEKFQALIASMGLEPGADAFVINRAGVFQTPSRFYGPILKKCGFNLPPAGSEPHVIDMVDPRGRPVLVGYTPFVKLPFVLVVVKPRTTAWAAWHTLESELWWIFLVSVVIIFAVIFRLTGVLVRRIEVSEAKERQAIHEMEQSNKLASIGQLAAGVAHEINNPVAIIDQKAGLMKDYIQASPDLPQAPKFNGLADSILQAVDRVRTITHRLLGFARRMDVEITIIDLNEVLGEVLGFLENEARHRNIDLRLNLASDLTRIASDHGQLQQAFLNILTNAFAAVEDGGWVSISTWEPDMDSVAVAIQDNGRGMSEETMNRIFEPFFTTKKGYGTGLGLSITYGIIRKLGGEITVQSALGRGTTFKVTLPRKSQSSAGT